VKEPRVRLTRVDVVDYKVDKQGSTFRFTLGADGGFLRKEEINPRPSPSGLESPLPLADIENPGNGSPTQFLAPTEIMDSTNLQEENEGFDHDSLEGSDIDVGDDDAVLTPTAKKRGRGRLPSTWERVGKRKKEKARAKKKTERERLAAESLKPTAPKGRKWAQLQDEEEELEARLAEAPTEDIASRLMERSVTVFNIAKCSNGLNGSVVKKLQETAILIQAATSWPCERGRCREEGI